MQTPILRHRTVSRRRQPASWRHFAWALSAWFGAAAARCVHSLADELRIRRDTRQLMAMSDEMLKDIGLTRAAIGGAVRYGRE
jgi:uncharacterized protein YjiS (DUF1127 family)